MSYDLIYLNINKGFASNGFTYFFNYGVLGSYLPALEIILKIEKINKESFVGWTVEEILEDIMDMGNDIFTKRYQDLIEQFDQSLDTNNYNKAKKAFDELLKIIHPNSSQRKILELQLSQLIPNND